MTLLGVAGLGMGSAALVACVVALFAGTVLVSTIPVPERGLVRLTTVLAATVGLLALIAAARALPVADAAAELAATSGELRVRWASGWRPLTLPGLSGRTGLVLELRGMALPGLLGTFAALIGLGLAVGTREESEQSVAPVFVRLLAAGGFAAVAYLATDLLVAASAWLGVRLAASFALRADMAPAGRRRLDDRAVVAAVSGLAVLGVVLAGAMTYYDLSDGIFATEAADLEQTLMPIGRQYVVATILALALFAALGVVPFHRGLDAGFEHAPQSAAVAFAIELGVAVHLWWVLGGALAPVAVAELSDTVALVAVFSAGWRALVARVRRDSDGDRSGGDHGAALGALTGATVAFAVFGASLGRAQALTGAAGLVLAGQLGMVAFAGTRAASRPLATRTGVVVAVLGALAVVGMPPSPGYAGLLDLTHAGLDETTSQMRWPEGITVALSLCVVVALVAALRPTLGVGLGTARADADEDEDVFGARATARALCLGLGAMLLAAGLVVGPIHGRASFDAVRRDAQRAEARCIGVAARDLIYPARRTDLPVQCDDAHAGLRRAYGLTGAGEASE